VLAVGGGCGSAEHRPECSDAAATTDAPALRCELTASPLGAGDRRLGIGVFVGTTAEAGNWTPQDAEELVRDALAETSDVLAGCGLWLDVETSQVTTLPASLFAFEGNAEGAWGGLAPEGEDPDAFNYALDERLSEEPLALFGYARASLSPGTIAIVVVDQIDFHAAGELRSVGGLSFPPVVYHHEDDHPTRNAVAVAATYNVLGGLPQRINGLTIAHELGHMLLDTAQHEGPDGNFMRAGNQVTAAQCDSMRLAAETTFGAMPLADPRL
jgi:hypothetical protein